MTKNERHMQSFCGRLRGKFTRTMPIIIGGINKLELIEQVKTVRKVCSAFTASIVRHQKFTTLLNPEVAIQIELTPIDLGFTQEPTWAELTDIQYLAEWSKLNCGDYVVTLNPAEVGPHMAIQYIHQPRNELMFIMMEPVPDSEDDPNVFVIECGSNVDELFFGHRWVSPGMRISLFSHCSFRLCQAA